eukprot:CAMPEP_0195508842 /NCGR_PEP_ID=MMETSP0794_2-20130614/1946_1 /TAXON_ID=515487 /ORGANISM="Stephanopyxis turris, Strain CCMP 815" /LENGTH=247 /DNA_ID=CAMNT_0040635913 /DNA_START=48 /DNA_END=791 /DNA_ORIENTATION=+
MTSSGTNNNRKPNILLGITGSVAAVKGPELAVRLSQECHHANVRILLTRGGENFWCKAKDYDSNHWLRFESLVQKKEDEANGRKEREDGAGLIRVHAARDEWNRWNRLGDPILHIELRDWADVIVIAPLSAHTLAKIASGLCDDPLTCCLRAWDFGHDAVRAGKPIVLAPAMNTAMWDHPLTRMQLDAIRSFWKDEEGEEGCENGVHVVDPKKDYKLACGEVGAGALADLECIVNAVRKCLDIPTLA